MNAVHATGQLLLLHRITSNCIIEFNLMFLKLFKSQTKLSRHRGLKILVMWLLVLDYQRVSDSLIAREDQET